MLQGIETVNNYANLNSNRKNTDFAKMMVNSNSESAIAASQDEVAKKIKRIERSEKSTELKNRDKDKLLEFLERKVGRGEILSHDENLYVMGKKSKLYEQSMNMQKIRDQIIQRLSNKKEDETIEQIYKELTEELKKEYGIEQTPADVNEVEKQDVSDEQSEEYIMMTNALQNNFIEYASLYESPDATDSTEIVESDLEDEVHLLGSNSDGEEVKTDLEKEVEARMLEVAMGTARERLDNHMFSKIDSNI